MIGPLLATTLVAGAAAALVTFFPGFLLGLMYGSMPPEVAQIAVELVGVYVWAALPLVWVEVLLPYLWARGKSRAALGLWLPVGLYLFALLGTDGPRPMIEALAVAAGVAAIWLTAILILHRRRLSRDSASSQE